MARGYYRVGSDGVTRTLLKRSESSVRDATVEVCKCSEGTILKVREHLSAFVGAESG